MSLILTGSSLTIESLDNAIQLNLPIQISPEAFESIEKSHSYIKKIVQDESVVYGVTTGFGSLKDIVISKNDVKKLQENLLRSHSCGVGEPISMDLVKRMFILRINTLVKGYSGVSRQLIEYLVRIYNIGIFGKVPSKGSVGASGDLAPLSHLFVGYLGEGELFDPEVGSYAPAKNVLSKYQFPLMELGPKEGLALNNGTPFMSAHLSEAMVKISRIMSNANVVAALTLEALHGTHRAFTPGIHIARGQSGQIEVASTMKSILANSELHQFHSMGKVQDAYSLRCIPQVHGVVSDTIKFCDGILSRELNGVTDNPLVIDNDVVSGGNFHGQYLASIADYLSIALTTLGNMSERRIERLVNGNLSKLPSFLVANSSNLGLESGYMIVQYSAAALCAENRTLSNAGSVHTIPTCENSEDHVSMGAYCVRKLLQIVDNVSMIVAIELLCGVQAKEFTKEKSSFLIEEVCRLVRTKIPRLECDRYVKTDLDEIIELMKQTDLMSLNKPELKIEPKFELALAKGTRDFAPRDIIIRDYLFDLIKNKFVSYGGEGISTPVFELKSTLMGKYGEDSKLIYDLEDQGGQLLSLRYDLTVPFARYIAMNKITHMRKYHIGQVYRRDQPKMNKGRFREFWQCDFDICGKYESLLPEAECIKIMHDILSAIDIGKFIIRVSNRKILDGFFEVCGVEEKLIRMISSAVDKLDKTPWDDVRKEMIQKGLSEETCEKIKKYVQIKGSMSDVLSLLKKTELMKNSRAKEGIEELEGVMKLTDIMKCTQDVQIDLSLARGLDYYTGIIYEAVVTDAEVGTVAAGGRYDKLIGMFSGKDIPAVGFSIGVERIMAVLNEKSIQNLNSKDVQIIYNDDSHMNSALKLSMELREEGLKVICDYSPWITNKSLKKKITSSIQNKIRVLCLVWQTDNMISIKNIEKNEQTNVHTISDAVVAIKNILG